MMSKFKKLMAAALVLCLMLALLPVGVLADGKYTITVDTGLSSGGMVMLDSEGIEVNTADKTFLAVSGKQVKVSTVLNPGYGVLSVKVYETADPESIVKYDIVDSKYVFTMPENNVTVEVKFSKYYNVSFDPNNASANSNSVMEGDWVVVTPTTPSGYKLESVWYQKSDADVKTVIGLIDGKYKFIMPDSDVTVGATFTELPDPPAKQYSVFTRVDGTGGTIAQGNQKYAEGETVTVSVSPDNGYELDQLYYIVEPFGSILGENIDKTTKSFKMPASNVMVVATFKPIENYKFNIKVDTDTHCKAKYQSTAEPGEWVEVCIDDFDHGYHLYSVTFNGELVTDDVYWYNGHWHYSFRMPWHDVKIYVATTDKLFVNTVYDINGGAVELLVKDAVSGDWDSTIFADAGDWVCVKATPKSGYELGDISVTGRWYGKSYDAYYNRYDGCYYFKMPYESVNLSVSFVDNSHKVIVKDVTNGSLKANTKWAVEDERVYITAVPNKGYELTWLYVKAADGTSVKVYEAIKADTYYFFMPDQEVTVSAIFAYDYPDMPFIDVNPNSWYYSAIEFVYNKGIMNGVTASSFNPDGTITRGMIVTMLWRMAGEPSAVSAGFADVAADSYYAKAIAWAAKNGIIEGYSASSFGPNDAITREQLATVLYRYAKYLGYTTTGSSLSGYYDASRVSSWAKDAMGWAVKNGVVTGLSSTWLNPNGTASRAEAAQMFMNFYEFLG